MSVFFGWLIIGFLAALVTFIPPILMVKADLMFRTYWDCFKEFNTFLWGFLGACGIVTGLLILALNLLGVL